MCKGFSQIAIANDGGNREGDFELDNDEGINDETSSQEQ